MRLSRCDNVVVRHPHPASFPKGYVKILEQSLMSNPDVPGFAVHWADASPRFGLHGINQRRWDTPFARDYDCLLRNHGIIQHRQSLRLTVNRKYGKPIVDRHNAQYFAKHVQNTRS